MPNTALICISHCDVRLHRRLVRQCPFFSSGRFFGLGLSRQLKIQLHFLFPFHCPPFVPNLHAWPLVVGVIAPEVVQGVHVHRVQADEDVHALGPVQFPSFRHANVVGPCEPYERGPLHAHMLSNAAELVGIKGTLSILEAITVFLFLHFAKESIARQKTVKAAVPFKQDPILLSLLD